MKDRTVQDLACRAGIMVEWTDYAGEPHIVTTESLRAVLAALGLRSETADDVAESRNRLKVKSPPPLITAIAGERIRLPSSAGVVSKRAVLCEEDGVRRDVTIELRGDGGVLRGVANPGYHQLEFDDEHFTIAVAPRRCPSIGDVTGAKEACGLAAQIYALSHTGDCGIGDAGAVIELAAKAAEFGIDMLALSPVHALFGAEPRHVSPYSPSSRLFYNPLHADARLIFDEARVKSALLQTSARDARLELDSRALIDWPRSAAAKIALFRCLFDEFVAHDLPDSASALAADFLRFRADRGKSLEDHAVFEALHAHQIRMNPAMWGWPDWPASLRNPSSVDVRHFAADHEREVDFQCFLQWLADRSLKAAQRRTKQAGMRIGLVADLAVGMSAAGSQAWAGQGDTLMDLEIGAPPDLYNTKGQNWGLTTFSPRALAADGFSSYLATLRAGLRHAGGLRIDHAMGLLRLWVIPRGADPTAGAYLSYPIKDLLRLTALEAHRHNAIIIGEDLGTIPPGFRDSMVEAGVYGMRILWFERAGRRFKAPGIWDVAAAAMTSTHDLPTVAGWWRGTDIESRAQAGLVKDVAPEQHRRANERRSLWHSFRRAKAATGDEPRPDEAARAVDAAIKYVAEAASEIALLPLEDALALEEQPNVPGTIDEFPNWRRRYPSDASELLSAPEVEKRVRALAQRGRA